MRDIVGDVGRDTTGVSDINGVSAGSDASDVSGVNDVSVESDVGDASDVSETNDVSTEGDSTESDAIVMMLVMFLISMMLGLVMHDV